MAEIKYKWLFETAKAFNMNIAEFAKYIGYSRQMIYQCACGITKMERGRLAVCMYKLYVLNEKIYNADKEAAKTLYEHRNKLIDELEERLTG